MITGMLPGAMHCHEANCALKSDICLGLPEVDNDLRYSDLEIVDGPIAMFYLLAMVVVRVSRHLPPTFRSYNPSARHQTRASRPISHPTEQKRVGKSVLPRNLLLFVYEATR
jgi:hypothetical protein